MCYSSNKLVAASHEKQRGAVLILVLVCLLAMASLVMSNQEASFQDAFSARRLAAEYEASILAESGLRLAVELLRKDKDPLVDSPLDPWGPVWRHKDLRIYIVPCNARININGLLASDRAREAVMRLLPDEFTAADQIATAMDWLDSDEDKERLYGAEGELYRRLDPRVTPRNGEFATPGEITLVSGWREFEPQWIRQRFTVWGDEEHKLNLNFVSRETLVAYIPEMDRVWESVTSWKEQKGLFRDVSELRLASPLIEADDQLYTEIIKHLSVKSSFFEIWIEVDRPALYEARRYIIDRSSGSPTIIRGDVMDIKARTL